LASFGSGEYGGLCGSQPLAGVLAASPSGRFGLAVPGGLVYNRPIFGVVQKGGWHLFELCLFADPVAGR